VVMAPMYAFPVPELLFLIVAVLWLLVLVGWASRALMRAGIATAPAIFVAADGGGNFVPD
jgi:hypothetical protein